MTRELLLGCGSRRDKLITPTEEKTWVNLVTLDIAARHDPDVVADLEEGIPFSDDSFTEVHAYEVLEHLGRQGDAKSFFFIFSEIWRVLVNGGLLCATCPAPDSPWVWGDPGHTRMISPECLIFLSQKQYEAQCSVTPMTDYRDIYTADFEPVWMDVKDSTFAFVLKAIK